MTDTDDLFEAILANPGAFFAGLSTADPREGIISEPSAPGYQRVPFAPLHAGAAEATFPAMTEDVLVWGGFVADARGRLLWLMHFPRAEWVAAGEIRFLALDRARPATHIQCVPVPLAVLAERKVW